jgi:hypothetical protein
MLGEVIFSLLVISSIYIDLANEKTKQCIRRNRKVLPSLILHHILSIFAYFGWMLTNKTIKQIYLFTPPLLYLHWKTYGFCYWTVLTNKQCDWPKGKSLNDLLQYFGLKDNSFFGIVPYYLIVIFVGYLIGLYKYFN